MPRWIWIFLACTLAALLWASQRTPAQGSSTSQVVACALPPFAASSEPMQSPVPAAMQPFQHGEFTISPLAAFSVEARVLGREDYSFGPEAALSPTDLALGWQRMADQEVYGALGISQSGRWYRYTWMGSGPPIPLKEIIVSSANMHMIPADDSVAAALERVRPEQMVRLQGWLIQARRDDGWTWRSSLTREDSGNGACELVYVCALTAY